MSGGVVAAEVDGVVAELAVQLVGHLHQAAVPLVVGLGEEVELHAFLLADVGQHPPRLFVEEPLAV